MNTLVISGKRNAVLIPVAVILVPRPGAPNPGIFHDHFRVVVIHLAFQNLFRRVHHRFAAREHSVDRIARMVPQGQAHLAALAVSPPERVLIQFAIFFGRTAQHFDIFSVEEAFCQRIAFVMVIGNLLDGERRVWHCNLHL
jgi:hypothetical protein